MAKKDALIFQKTERALESTKPDFSSSSDETNAQIPTRTVSIIEAV
jgi:hypothetical protein